MSATLLRTLFVVVVLAVNPLWAADWPTHLHDNRRSGFTIEQLDAPRLKIAWTWSSPHPPQPAWAGPAKWDAYAGNRNLPSMRNYDPVFHVTAADGSIFFGSSLDDAVHCLDARTGKARWTVTTDGPIRIAPTIADGRVYFGSDDGFAYCLDAKTGRELWKFTPKPTGNLILNNGRFIPTHPCRTGVMVEKGTAYFGCALLPWHEAWLCGVDALTGQPKGPGRFVHQLKGHTLEAPPAASSKLLIFPQGRVAPQVFRRNDGKDLGSLKKSGGGSVVVVSLDARIFHGPAADTRKGAFKSTAAKVTGEGKTLEMVAGYGRGNALVVAGRRSFMLTDEELIASDLATRKTLWSIPCDFPLSLIAGGETLFAGGVDQVGAFSAKDGQRLWSAPVKGKVFGLAIANGKLLVSTDVGRIYAFTPRAKPIARSQPKPSTTADLPPLAKVPAVRDPGLIGRWVFQKPHLEGRRVNNLAARGTATLKGRFQVMQDGQHQVLKLDGGGRVMIAEDHTTAGLPKQKISLSAWVRIDKTQEWGGIIGAIQDNGTYEHGWILGFNHSKFSFALAGTKGNGALTYLKAPSDFEARRWYHVAASYDGQLMKLFVNGKQVAQSSVQKGPISYPPKAYFEIGAYHDKDENFPLNGRIHEVRLYRRVLTAEEVARQFTLLAEKFPTTPPVEDAWQPLAGPWFQFDRPGSALVRWRTRKPVLSELELQLDGPPQTVRGEKPTTIHELRLSGLKYKRIYAVTLRSGSGKTEQRSAAYELDTFFDYSQQPVDGSTNRGPATTRAGKVAEGLLARSGIDRGLCLVVGLHDGSLAHELVRQSQLRVLVIDTDRKRIQRFRTELQHSGIYGSRITARHVESFQPVPLIGHWANLVVSESMLITGTPPCSAAELARLIRPDGGQVILGQPATVKTMVGVATLNRWLGPLQSLARVSTDPKQGTWASILRGPLDGSGDWSHLYGSADNSSFAGEKLAGAKSASDLAVQWVGRPGPRYQADRNGRKPAPLSTAGRLFLQGLHRIVAVDAFNGSILWALEIPDLQRFNMPRDSSNWCADREFLYVAIRDRLWQIDVRDGRVAGLLETPSPAQRKGPWDWGYIARTGEKIIGTSVRRATSWTGFWGGAGAGWYDARSGEVTHKVCSDTLFSIDRQTGKVAWNYQNGVVLNSTLTIADDRIYFVECRHEAVTGAPERRVGRPELWQKQFLVAMDANSGSLLWEKPIQLPPGKVVFYMAHAKDRLIVVGSADGKYHVHSFAAANGDAGWTRSFGWPGGKGDHGKAMSRPAIVGDRVYVRPQVLSLTDGTNAGPQMPGGGCGTYACSSGALFFRAGTVTVWNRENAATSTWKRLRPDCWLSTIPAGGMLLSPEGGGGCSCGTWMETSVGFIPRRHRTR